MEKTRQSVRALLASFLILAILVPTALAGPAGEDIQSLYRGDQAFGQVVALTDIGPRVAGGPAELEAAEYIAAQMASYGLKVEMQSFPVYYYEEIDSAMAQVAPTAVQYVNGVDYDVMMYSGSGDVTAAVRGVDLVIPPGPAPNSSTSGCEAADFAGFVAGSIALMQRGTCSFAIKATNAQAAGAAGAIIMNEGQPGRDGLFFGTLSGPVVTIPVVGTTYALGAQFASLVPSGLTVHLFTETAFGPGTSYNVIGTLKGTDPKQGIVYIGGHYDSVSGAVGANDDASGTASVLEAARVLGRMGHTTKATLKFLAFGAEEVGLVGSLQYVQANLNEVSTKGLGMVNLDMVGVGDTLQIGAINPAGNPLRDYAAQKAGSMGLTWEYFPAGSNSDHTYFEQAGVPVAFITQRPDPYYHTTQDSPDKISVPVLEKNGELATAVIYDWAKNPVLRAKKAAKLEKVHVYRDKVLVAE